MNELSKMSNDAHADAAIHQKWVANYCIAEMQAVYDMSFNLIAGRLNILPDSMNCD